MYQHILLHHEFGGSIYSLIWLIPVGVVVWNLKRMTNFFKKR